MVKAIMYHYVRRRDEWVGSVPIEPYEFEQQIIRLKEKYTIITPENLHKETEKPKCIITFDDATKDQYTTAFPILQKYNVPAYFAVMSGPLEQRRVPTFHMVHAVLSYFTDKEVWEDLQGWYGPLEVSRAHEYYGYEQNPDRRNNKYILNLALAEIEARTYLEYKLKKVYNDMDNFIDNFYISIEELKEMQAAGMTLGVHCVNHLPYNNNPQKYYDKEIAPCQAFMEKELGIKPIYYTPAFGGGIHYQSMLLNLAPILKSNGIKKGFAINNENKVMSDFWIPRVDCNNLKEYL